MVYPLAVVQHQTPGRAQQGLRVLRAARNSIRAHDLRPGRKGQQDRHDQAGLVACYLEHLCQSHPGRIRLRILRPQDLCITRDQQRQKIRQERRGVVALVCLGALVCEVQGDMAAERRPVADLGIGRPAKMLRESGKAGPAHALVLFGACVQLRNQARKRDGSPHDQARVWSTSPGANAFSSGTHEM